MANPITYHDMTPAVGAKVSVKFEDIRVLCTVRNVKSSYGRVRLEVVPDSGSGSQWVEVSRLTLVPVIPPQTHCRKCAKDNLPLSYGLCEDCESSLPR